MTNGTAAIVVSLMVAFFATNTTLIVFLFKQIGKTERSLRADMRADRADMNAGYDRLKADMNAGYDRLKADMNAGFDRLQTGQDNLKAEIGDLSRRVSNLESDVAVLKTDVAVLKSDVAVLKTDVTVLKADVTALKSNVTGWTPIIMALIARSVSAGETALASEPAPPPAVSEPDSG